MPAFKGNDTGGIVAYTLATQADARQLAVDHCACAGAPASIPPMATRHAAIILRIADSISLEAHHSVSRSTWKEWVTARGGLGRQVLPRCT